MTAQIHDFTTAKARADIDSAIADFVACGYRVDIIEDRGTSVVITAYDPSDRGSMAEAMIVVIDPSAFPRNQRKRTAST